MEDIIEMFNQLRLKEALRQYKKDFVTTHWNEEKYKWEAVKCFQDNWDIHEALITRFTRAHKIPSASAGGIFLCIHSKRKSRKRRLAFVVRTCRFATR